MTILNLIVADQLKVFKADVDVLIAEGMKKDDALFNALKGCIIASKVVRFEGDAIPISGRSWPSNAA